MRDSERIDEILNKLRELWENYPEQRFGQLLENYVFIDGERGDKTSFKMFYQDDDLTETRMDDKLWEIENKSK